MEAGILSSTDYLCTSSRDSFHCSEATSREVDGVKATEKCFYLARLSSLLKVRFFRESRGPRESNAAREKEIAVSQQRHPPTFSYLCFSHFERLRQSSGLTAREILTRVNRSERERKVGEIASITR